MEKVKIVDRESCFGCEVNERINWFHDGMKLSEGLMDYDEVLKKAEDVMAVAASEEPVRVLAELKTYQEILKKALHLVDWRLRFCAIHAKDHKKLLGMYLFDADRFLFVAGKLKSMAMALDEKLWTINKSYDEFDLLPIEMSIARSISVIGLALEPFSNEGKDKGYGETESIMRKSEVGSARSPEVIEFEQLVYIMARFLGLGTKVIKDGLHHQMKEEKGGTFSQVLSEEEKHKIRSQIAVPEEIGPKLKQIQKSIIYMLIKEMEGALVNSMDSLENVLKLCQQLEEFGSSSAASDIKATVEITIKVCANLRFLKRQLGFDSLVSSCAAYLGPVSEFHGIERCRMLNGIPCPHSLGE